MFLCSPGLLDVMTADLTNQHLCKNWVWLANELPLVCECTYVFQKVNRGDVFLKQLEQSCTCIKIIFLKLKTVWVLQNCFSKRNILIWLPSTKNNSLKWQESEATFMHLCGVLHSLLTSLGDSQRLQSVLHSVKLILKWLPLLVMQSFI